MVESLMKKKNINYTSCKDVDYMIKAIEEFYNTVITLDENGNVLLK